MKRGAHSGGGAAGNVGGGDVVVATADDERGGGDVARGFDVLPVHPINAVMNSASRANEIDTGRAYTTAARAVRSE